MTCDESGRRNGKPTQAAFTLRGSAQYTNINRTHGHVNRAFYALRRRGCTLASPTQITLPLQRAVSRSAAIGKESGFQTCPGGSLRTDAKNPTSPRPLSADFSPIYSCGHSEAVRASGRGPVQAIEYSSSNVDTSARAGHTRLSRWIVIGGRDGI